MWYVEETRRFNQEHIVTKCDFEWEDYVKQLHWGLI